MHDIIKERMQSLGIKQCEFAERMEWSKSCCSRKLNGSRKITVKELVEICEILNLDVKELI